MLWSEYEAYVLQVFEMGLFRECLSMEVWSWHSSVMQVYTGIYTILCVRPQVKQIGVSACGPTAVLNILRYFDITVPRPMINRAIKANLRQETAPIPQYLFSRSVAGNP